MCISLYSLPPQKRPPLNNAINRSPGDEEEKEGGEEGWWRGGGGRRGGDWKWGRGRKVKEEGGRRRKVKEALVLRGGVMVKPEIKKGNGRSRGRGGGG